MDTAALDKLYLELSQFTRATTARELIWISPKPRDEFAMNQVAKDAVCLNARRCELCRNWTRRNPDDLTAPEGDCKHPKWSGPLWIEGKWPTFGYHPATLRRDNCKHFRRAAQ